MVLPEHTEPERLRIVLVDSRNPLNIGAAARAMGNFGFRHLCVVNPYPPSFREARSAVGASALLATAEEHQSVAGAVAACSLVVGTTAVRNRVVQQPLYQLETGARLICKHLCSGRVAVLFGSERVGLSNQDLSHCHWLMRIPTCEEHLSVNLGQSVAVCLYELARCARGTKAAAQPLKEDDRATGFEVERITELLNEALRQSGYPGPASSNRLKVRRLVHRMRLSGLDAEVWQGILRQLLWKIRSGKT